VKRPDWTLDRSSGMSHFRPGGQGSKRIRSNARRNLATGSVDSGTETCELSLGRRCGGRLRGNSADFIFRAHDVSRRESMRKKPLIGLNADYRASKKDSPAFSYVAAGYYDSISAVGGVPVIMPPVAEADDLARVLDQLDGVVLVGGADLDPRNDGYM